DRRREPYPYFNCEHFTCASSRLWLSKTFMVLRAGNKRLNHHVYASLICGIPVRVQNGQPVREPRWIARSPKINLVTLLEKSFVTHHKSSGIAIIIQMEPRRSIDRDPESPRYVNSLTRGAGIVG